MLWEQPKKWQKDKKKESSITMSYGVNGRRDSDLALLWLWCPPVAVDLIQPLAWELLYAMAAVLKNKTKQNKTKRVTLP